ncbi:MAG: sulfatase-like hydrolase/transferase [Planctomycetota bacterium]
MKRTHALVLVVLLAWQPAFAVKPSEAKPNVLLFLVDDMGLMDTSVPFLADRLGHPTRYPLNDFYRTPSMERLAALGTRYSQFYANSVCSPTRTTLMSGQYSARHHTTQFIRPENRNTGEFGPVDWKWEGFAKTDPTLPAQLRAQGYRTIHSGKAHFGPIGYWAENPANIGFDVNIAGCSFGQPGSYLGEKNYGHGIDKRQKRAVPGLESYHGTETHLTEAITIEMKAAISSSVAAGMPFFAYMSHYAVHAPFEADSRFIDHYRDASNPRLAAFASLIEGMDKSLGDLLDHLELLGVAENTFVIFLGDNGTDAPIGDVHQIACSAPLRGKKGTHYEGGMRVPMIAAWAKKDEGNGFQSQFPVLAGRLITNGFAHIADVPATIMNLTGTKPGDGHRVDGMSLLPSIGGQPLPQDREFLMHFPHSHRSSYFTSYRRGNHKLIYHYPVGGGFESNKAAGAIEMFDLVTDPDESHNLASRDPDLAGEMLSAMQSALADSHAQFPTVDGEEVRPDWP